MKLFREEAKRLGCENFDEMGDLAVWEFLMKLQREYHQMRIDQIDAFNARERYDA